MRRLAMIAAAAAVVFGASTVHAQLSEVDLERGPTSELYIKKRPSVPEEPELPEELATLLDEKRKARDGKRTEAIDLLRAFLDSDPIGESRADGLFKLAELLWEDSRLVFVDAMDSWERDLEACRQPETPCEKAPTEPRLDLTEAESLYKAILADHPDYKHTDLVLYLVGFAAKEHDKHDESMQYFFAVIERFPNSPLYGDSWMMIGEYYFAAEKWEMARDAYSNILDRPESATYDLALFKTAWCDWKLGDTEQAALRFKEVLDLAVEAERTGSARTRRRRAQLRDEALDYLVIVFTEDQSISAKEVYDFLASIGGEQYSADVLLRVAEAYNAQGEYDRSVETYKFLIDLKPDSLNAAKYQRNIVNSYLDALDLDQATVELKVLVEAYGPGSDWAKSNKSRPERLAKSLELTEELVRQTATNIHAEAQQNQKASKQMDPALFTRAADAYAYYLTRYEKNENAARIRYMRAEILFWKLEKWEEAGDEYLAVGKTAPVGEFHEDALLKAIKAFENARPPHDSTQGKRELLPVDRKFAEAIDLYATLFESSPQMVNLIYRNGLLFYDYGDYDEAIKRFGLIVTKYPEHDDAGPAGDRILKALVQGEDYENIEEWARKLKKAKAFQSKEQQDRLDRLIVESIGKSGEKYAEGGKYARAANFYLRIPKEFPDHKLAAPSMMNAGVMLEKAKRPEAAAGVYLDLADAYPKDKDAPKAAFTAAKVYEKVAYYDRAAEAYEVVIEKFPKNKTYGADALFNAGLLRQALGQYELAIAHYALYAKRYRKKKDAEDVAFNIGVVYEEQGDDGLAVRAYKDYVKRFGRKGKHVVQAYTRAGRALIALGKTRRSAEQFKLALKRFKKTKGAERERSLVWAAEARYYQGEIIYQQYADISLDVSPRKLDKTLDKKTKLLEKAQGVYLDVVDMGDAQWATAALFRIGNVYDEFAESLRTTPCPPEIKNNEEFCAEYKDALEVAIIDIEERAIDLYITGYQKAIELKVYNKYTSRIREALGRLASDEYPPENESRSKERVGDRPPAPGIVKEVLRDE
jgi:tetratricopeptide (TPR) repeat protein